MISIIIPSRNRPELVARALKGIQSQTYFDYEALLIDDHSDEVTHQAYQALWLGLDQRFKLVRMGAAGESGLGPSISRNRGVRQTSGEIIAFCDDDDFWCDDDYLNRLASAFTALPDLDLHIANQRAVRVSGQCSEDWLPGLTARVKGRSKTNDGSVSVSTDDLCASGGFAHLNILTVRRSVFDTVGGFWERVSYEEDRDFFWRAVNAAKGIRFNPTVVAQHNVPDPQARKNLSTAHSQAERLMFSNLVSQHILISVTHRSIARLAGGYSGDLLRRLTLAMRDSGHTLQALIFAKQALAARFSIKWAAYILMLTIQDIFFRLRK